jgi:PII-like signaling protein
MGFGLSSRLHSTKVLRLSEDLPIIVEIVDSEENISKLLPYLDEVVQEGLITIEKATILKYRHKS